MPLDRTPWTDDTIMPWGPHRGTRLGDVPPEYLLELWETSWIRDGSWPGLLAYLRENEDTLEEQRRDRDRMLGEIDSYDDYRSRF